MADLFEERHNNLKRSSMRAGDQLFEGVSAPWFALQGPEATDIVDPFDNEKTLKAFNRDAEGADYQRALDTPESFRTVQAVKLKNDALAALERDTRLRHRSRVRMLAHSVAKLKTHGLDAGPIRRGVMFVNRIMESTGG